jgi:hypothetical protein
VKPNWTSAVYPERLPSLLAEPMVLEGRTLGPYTRLGKDIINSVSMNGH